MSSEAEAIDELLAVFGSTEQPIGNGTIRTIEFRDEAGRLIYRLEGQMINFQPQSGMEIQFTLKT